MNYRRDIDGLRALSVILVFFFHLDIGFFSGGFIGVDVFFVISGFLITSLLLKEWEIRKTISFSAFYKRRIRRLLPAILMTNLFVIFIGFILLSPNDLIEVSWSIIYSIFGLANILFYQDTNYWTLEKTRPLLHMWSLAVEEQFYLFWPLLIFIFKKKFKTLLPIFLFFVLVSFGLNIFNPWGDSALYFLTPFRVFELAFGSCLASYKEEIKGKDFRFEGISLLGFVFILMSSIFLKKTDIFPSYNAIPTVVGTGLIILSSKDVYLNRFLSSNVFVWIGLRSYSLYLIHWPLIVFWSYYTGKNLSLKEITLIFLISFLLADFMFRFVEKPFRKENEGIKLSFNKVIYASIFCILFLNFSSFYIFHKKGLPERLSAEKLDLLKNITANGQAKKGRKCSLSGNCNMLKNNSHDNIALLGRSHARHYTDGLIFYDKSFMYYRLNCYSFLGDFCPLNTAKPLKAKQVKDDVLKKIKNGKFSTLILSEVLLYSLTGVLNPETNRFLRFSSDAEWLSFMKNQLISFKKYFSDKKIILIGENPRINTLHNGADNCIAKPLSKIDTCLTFEKDKHWEYLNLELAKISKEIGIDFFDPYSVVCKNDKCSAWMEQMSMFQDSHHFSPSGSIILIRELQKKLL